MEPDLCKLTRKPGKFIASHLIPQAFTRPPAGEGFISGGEGSRPKRSWSSWYDRRLVIRKGEKVLADYDNWAVRELRRLELVWSGWGRKTCLPIEDYSGSKQAEYGLRQLECADPDKLRLFFLSLLWRAAATELPEFHAVRVPLDDLERLRRMLVDGDPRPLDFYPTSLLQIVSRGDSHNLAPIAQDLGSPNNFDSNRTFRTFRFYFDGLIAHIYRHPRPELIYELGQHLVGYSTKLLVKTQKWKKSFQFANMKQHIAEGTVLSGPS
jgi:hypothetical protein